MSEAAYSENLSDERLYDLCRQYGEAALHWRRKFLGLLPEVFKRRLYIKKGFQSIFEFAAKLAGVSERQAGLVLGLEERFRDKRNLHRALVDGEVSVNKLERLASIATNENQSFLLEQAKLLSKSALEVFVRDEKMSRIGASSRSGELDLQKGNFEECVTPGRHLENDFGVRQVGAANSVPVPLLTDEVKVKLCELQQKGIDINAMILEMLERRDRDLAERKARLVRARAAEDRSAISEFDLLQYGILRGPSRYIPAKVKRILHDEYGTQCSMSNCRREAEHIHHEIPFAMTRGHDPNNLRPLCKEHHAIAHKINLAYARASGGG